MKKFYAITNLAIIIAVIAANSMASVRGLYGNTVGGISEKYDTLFAPAGYAFSIWGVIYIGLIAFGLFQFKRVFFDKKEDEFILKIGPWLSIANLANIIWLWAWLSESLGLSLILMVIILFSLVIIILKLNMERWDAPFPVVAWIWWPLCIYSGWIAVATIANVSAYLVKLEWHALFSDLSWTIVMIIIAVVLNLLIILYRKMYVFAVVGVWALLAISIRHWDNIALLQWTALAGALVLFIVISVHAFKNRATSLLVKLSEYYKNR